MNKLLNQLTTRDLAFEILPSFGLSLVMAELYFKFGSFTLECLAFLGTWYVLATVFRWAMPSKE
ncbi:MAG: hypothetical protein H6577_22190 [Lewinellaceae bacterium]|nr:hypothetical protein [Saprospiraceae bacterium]MCB9340845.1 hypothetical protein [Lewinellaceae bacterium]